MSDWNEAIVDSAAKKLRKFARHKYEISGADAKEAVLCVIRSLKRPSVSGGGEWQTIETAPKDETRVLLAKAGVHAMHTAFYRGGVWHCGNQQFFNSPTHWQPLPSPPTALKPPVGESDRGKVKP